MANYEQNKKKYYAGIEGGGTKFTCIVANHPQDIYKTLRIPTTSPEETLDRVITFFKDALKEISLKAMGIGSFGPLDIDPHSPNFGSITNTTKPGWNNYSITEKLKTSLNLPIALDTDVNAAALGEFTWGAAKDIDPFVYLTIGTGIGGGTIINGKLLHGLQHPEMGHMLLQHDSKKDNFVGICDFHHNCFEGLASGTAINGRWGQPAEDLPIDHPAWELEAHYIALGLVNIVLLFSPKKIILGGGVMEKPGLIELVRQKFIEKNNAYINHPILRSDIKNFITAPGLGEFSGRLGAIALALQIQPQGK